MADLDTTAFLNRAFRNIDLPPLSGDDMRDIGEALLAVVEKRIEELELAMDEALHWLARGHIDEADRIIRAVLKGNSNG